MRYFIMLLLLTTALFSGEHDSHSERHINKELSHLALSKEQNTEIKKILKEFSSDLKEYREFKEKIEVKRKEIFIAETLNIDELEKLNRALDDKSHEIENRLLKSMHSILSPKQRREFIYYFDDWEVE